MPTNTMKNTRFSVRQTDDFVRFRRSKAAPRIAKRAFSAHLSRFSLLHVEFYARSGESALNRFILRQSKKF